MDPVRLTTSQSKDKGQLLKSDRVLGIHDLQAACRKSLIFDAYCTTCYGACSYMADDGEGSSRHILSSRLFLTKPCLDGGGTCSGLFNNLSAPTLQTSGLSSVKSILKEVVVSVLKVTPIYSNLQEKSQKFLPL